jgi:hypothetical protein
MRPLRIGGFCALVLAIAYGIIIEINRCGYERTGSPLQAWKGVKK